MPCATPTIFDYKTISEQKKFLRNRAKSALKEYCSDSALMESCSQSMANSFLSSEEYKNCKVLLGVMALSDEPNLYLIYRQALKDGKKIAFPRTRPSCEIDFFYVTDFENSFSTQNPYKIKEPLPQCKKVCLDTLPSKTVVFVPGLVFNFEGHRLGRGKGFYDRFLQQLALNNNDFCLCGVCFTICVTKAIPVEKHDVSVTYLLTEYGFIKCKKDSSQSILMNKAGAEELD